MEKERSRLIADLKRKWEKLSWPGLPPFNSDLNDPACKLMELDTFVAGCLSQILQKGKLDKKCLSILIVNKDLTNQIAATSDPKTKAFLEYKTQFDECISLAQKILQMEET